MRYPNLWKALEASSESTSFCHTGVARWVSPRLKVEGVGPVVFPLGSRQASQILEVARRAPYGKGEETIVDLDVRRVWQLEPAQFCLANPAWDEALGSIVEQIKAGFGLKRSVKAELYKLLIYETGGFFLPHRDTEKSKGMFATLVICLPSAHLGGDLMVTHEGWVQRISFAGTRPSEMQFAAFYADCQHEVKPVESGYRVCLVYNLCVGAGGKAVAPPRDLVIEPVVRALRQVFEKKELVKAVIPLSHEYSSEGLGQDYLKGADRARYQILCMAASRLEMEAYLCQLKWYQEGASYAEYGRWHRGPRNYKIDDVIKERATLTGWLDENDQVREFPPLRARKSEFLGKCSLTELPARKTVHEATGNEGVTVERRYRTAVVVLWPRGQYRRILTDQGQRVSLPVIESLLDRNTPPNELREWVAEALTHWRFPSHARFSQSHKRSQSARMLALLTRLEDPALATEFVTNILPKDFEGTEGSALVALAKVVGWDSLRPGLRAFFAYQKPGGPSLERVVSMLTALTGGKLSALQREVCRDCLPEFEAALAAYDGAPWPGQRGKLLEPIVQAFSALKSEDGEKRLAAHVIRHPKAYGVHEVILPYLLTGRAKGPARSLLLAHALEALRQATREPVVFPSDWAIDAILTCSCQACREAEAFLRDRDQQVHLYSAREDLRNHLQSKMSPYDVEFSVIKGRSPHTLRCQKNHASYQRRQQQYDRDQELLVSITRGAPGTPRQTDDS